MWQCSGRDSTRYFQLRGRWIPCCPIGSSWRSQVVTDVVGCVSWIELLLYLHHLMSFPVSLTLTQSRSSALVTGVSHSMPFWSVLSSSLHDRQVLVELGLPASAWFSIPKLSNCIKFGNDGPISSCNRWRHIPRMSRELTKHPWPDPRAECAMRSPSRHNL